MAYDERLMNADTDDYSDRATGVVPLAYVPRDALTPVPLLLRAGRLTPAARSRSAHASRPGDPRRNAGHHRGRPA